MLLADNTPTVPAYNLICTVDPLSAIANGKPAAKGIKTSARFTLTMTEEASPITITHLHQNEPKRVGELVHYPIRYQQPLFPPSETLTLKEAHDFAHIHINGQLIVDPMQMQFQLSGTCVERSINPQA